MNLSREQRAYKEILAELGWPRIYLLDNDHFGAITNDSIDGLDGISADRFPIVTVRRGLSWKALLNTEWHEVAHKLFPHRPHWWIDNFGERMAGGGGRGQWATKYNKPLEDFPSRDHLLKVARRAAKRKFGAKIPNE